MDRIDQMQRGPNNDLGSIKRKKARITVISTTLKWNTMAKHWTVQRKEIQDAITYKTVRACPTFVNYNLQS